MLRRLLAPLLAIAAQGAILVAVPGGRIVALDSGTPVTLATAPVDPYDFMSGWYTTLTYEVERPEPGLLPAGLVDGEPLWVTVQRAEPAWTLTGISRERPAPAPDRVSLPAIAGGRGGLLLQLRALDRFYISEAQREEVADGMREVRGRAFVDLRVGEGGVAVPIWLRIGELRFGRELY